MGKDAEGNKVSGRSQNTEPLSKNSLIRNEPIKVTKQLEIKDNKNPV